MSKIKLPPLPQDTTLNFYKLMDAYATAAVELNTPRHTEDTVRLILEAMDNIELRRPLANAIRRILGVPAP